RFVGETGARPAPGASSSSERDAIIGADRAAPTFGPETVTVVVRRADGAPCEGITVKLQRTDVSPRWHSDTATDAAGVAFFGGVPVGTYTLSAGVTGARPTTLEMLQVAPKSATRIDLRIAPRPRHAAISS